jgi:hypothetical protein|tara:strand:- start:188 stop:643 length:456 start_codon:yes stop_codon:yes gene_type:complete
MKIGNEKLESMFKVAGIEKKVLHDALLKMGTKQLKTKQMRDAWSEDNPTKNYCYVVSEMVFYYLAPKGSKPYKLPNIPGDDGLHRFLKWPDGTIVDLTVDQFPNYEDVNYENGKVCYFMQTGVKGPSKRARLLAELCDLKLPKTEENKFWD